MPGILTGPGIESIGANQEAANFANAVAASTGLDPRVVYAWAMQETGGKPYGGFHNWLNLRPYPGDPYSGVSPGNFEEYSSLENAEQAAIRRIKQPFAKGIIASAGTTPAEEISAIAASGWDAGHYGGPGGPNLLAEFKSLYPKANAGGAASSTTVTGTTGGGQTPGSLTSGVESVVKKPLKWIEGWIIRGMYIILGAGLALLGLYFIVRAFGGPSVAAMDTVATVATRGAVKPKSSAKSAPRKGDAAIERGEEVTRTSAPEPPTRADKRQAGRNAKVRQRAASERTAARDREYGGADAIPF